MNIAIFLSLLFKVEQCVSAGIDPNLCSPEKMWRCENDGGKKK